MIYAVHTVCWTLKDIPVHMLRKSTSLPEGQACTLGQEDGVNEQVISYQICFKATKILGNTRYTFKIRFNAYHWGIYNKIGQVIYISL